jgi:HlyD family secretion protein
MSPFRRSGSRSSVLRKRSVRILVRCAISAVVVGLITTGALAAATSHHPTYRTATVTRAAVNETLEQTGTIEPVVQATIAFPTSGTIGDVDVAVGDTVATGQTLAKLDTTSLQATLTAKESALADAELVLHKALNGESSSPTGGNGGASTGGNSSSAAQQAATTATTGASAADTATAGGGANAKLTAARDAVTTAEAAVRAALVDAQRALTAATQACNTTTTTTSTTTTVAATPPVSCSTAQAAVLQAQQKVADAENTLASAESKLAGLLAATGTSSGGSTSTPTTTPAKTTTNPTNASTITADQLVADEANVAAALANVNAANETLAQATIVSPIAGTVAAVSLSPGIQVSSDSSTANIVVVGRGGYEVTTTVTVAQRPKVAVGDAATVTPDGSSATLAGKVVSIGVATTSSSASAGSSSSTTSYPVTIGFTSEPAGLRNGASSAVTIVVAHSESVLTVPTSAVTTIGTGFHTVTVLANGKTSTVSIQIGTVGTDRTAVTSGLTAGQRVVLADLGRAIPSSDATTRFGGGGAFTGGRLGGGGFTRGG